MILSRTLANALITGLNPYFLERENVWFEKNLKRIISIRKTQSFWQDNTLFLEKDQKLLLSQLLRKLDELGYEKVFKVQEPGEFSQRGGVIEVFPVNLNYGVRLEFLGNKIDEITKLSIETRDEKTAKEVLKKKLRSQKIFSGLENLKPGDYIVHLDHGVAKFSRIEKIQIPNTRSRTQDYYILEYARGDKLYVPLGLERKLSRYVGFVDPKISGLGSPVWQRTKRKVKKEAEKLAKELLQIYAKRTMIKRSPYKSPDLIDSEIKASFKYEETPDQVKAVEDVQGDLKKEEPMDRIICGDVGFGKTEVALRTLARAVGSGFQAAFLAPTTILANQHFQNFKERLEKFPIRIDLLSRLQTKKEQKEIVKDLKNGDIDILIGTHRILSRDIEFKNLGLLVIDDEHRFGVKQKETLKKLRTELDVLSLTATPIPRTLYLALSSLRNISLIHTPPPGRLPVKTFVLPFSKRTIKAAVERELGREGQVFYLHNRIGTIQAVKKFLQELAPEASFEIVHGRMREKELINVMSELQEKKIDVLIATTIIESGLDFANVNTLIVEDATRLGLAELHQLRGRVGRSFKESFAYFFYSVNQLKGKAKERLKVLKESKDLGSGFQIALRDLEIRGAGNILGKEQSGSVNAVGLNLYCQIVSQAIERIKASKTTPA